MTIKLLFLKWEHFFYANNNPGYFFGIYNYIITCFVLSVIKAIYIDPTPWIFKHFYLFIFKLKTIIRYKTTILNNFLIQTA